MIFKVSLAIFLAFVTVEAAIVDPNPPNPGPTDPFATQRPPNYDTTTRVTAPPPICSYNGYWLNCSNFDSFTQLNFKNNSYRVQELLIISPLTPLDLDESFDLTGYDTKYASIRFRNIKSFPFLADQTRNIKAGKSLYIANSKLSFTQDEKSLSGQCDLSLLKKIDSNHLPFFSAFRMVGFEADNVLEQPICPLLFKGANLTSFTTKQPLKFISINETEDLDVHVEGFDISDTTFSLDTESVSPLIFKGIRSMRSYNGVITHIEEDFFKHFPLLKYMRLHLNNLEDFFRNVNPAWMKNANYLVNVNYSDPAQVLNNRHNDLLITMVDESGTYKFPEEDFCIFKDFPHHKMLFFQIDTVAQLECTCTLYWIHKHKQYKNFDYPLESTKKCFKADIFNKAIEECNFEQRLAECSNPATQTTTRLSTSTTEEYTNTHRTTTTPPRPTEYITTSRPVPVSTNGVINATHKSGLINIICNNCQNVLVVNKA